MFKLKKCVNISHSIIFRITFWLCNHVQPIIASKHYCSMKYPDPSSQSKGTLIVIMENYLHRIKNVTACIAFLSKNTNKIFCSKLLLNIIKPVKFFVVSAWNESCNDFTAILWHKSAATFDPFSHRLDCETWSLHWISSHITRRASCILIKEKCKNAQINHWQ